MSLQPFTLFSFNIAACGFVLVGLKIIIIIIIIICAEVSLKSLHYVVTYRNIAPREIGQ